jgi:hypothetical protein
VQGFASEPTLFDKPAGVDFVAVFATNYRIAFVLVFFGVFV